VRLQAEPFPEEQPPFVRLTWTLPASHPFQVRREGNDIVLTISKLLEGGGVVLEGMEVESGPLSTRVVLQTTGPVPEWRSGVLEDPPRLYVDLRGVRPGELEANRPAGGVVRQVRVGRREDGVRVVLDSGLEQMFAYDIQPGASGLVILAKAPERVRQEAEKDPITALIERAKGGEAVEAHEAGQGASLPPPPPMPAIRSAAPVSGETADGFAEAGYTRDRISVDFYKIDLHNVFRFLREVSGVNIVVDEGVQGVLTLNLEDVPWDFALDVILTLKDLKKIERYNTIVIVPKDKAFAWKEQLAPPREEQLRFEADAEVMARQAIVIQQRQSLSPRMIEAKKLQRQGYAAEQEEDYEQAVDAYEQSLAKWPENAALANRVASIYLVHFRQNAKALHFARQALAHAPDDARAALTAAVALANMERFDEAKTYFDQAIQAERPSREALYSYAVFNEQQQRLEGALALLRKVDELYGESLDTMVAEARILDKMGRQDEAAERYKSVILSGFPVPPDLRRYISARITMSQRSNPAPEEESAGAGERQEGEKP